MRRLIFVLNNCLSRALSICQQTLSWVEIAVYPCKYSRVLELPLLGYFVCIPKSWSDAYQDDNFALSGNKDGL